MIGGGKTCHVSIDDDKIIYGAFTQQISLQGFAVNATTLKNVYGARKTLLIRSLAPIDPQAPNANFIYWGGNGVDPTNGIPIAPGETVTFDFTAKKWIDIYIQGSLGLSVAIAEFV